MFIGPQIMEETTLQSENTAIIIGEILALAKSTSPLAGPLKVIDMLEPYRSYFQNAEFMKVFTPALIDHFKKNLSRSAETNSPKAKLEYIKQRFEATNIRYFLVNYLLVKTSLNITTLHHLLAYDITFMLLTALDYFDDKDVMALADSKMVIVEVITVYAELLSKTFAAYEQNPQTPLRLTDNHFVIEFYKKALIVNIALSSFYYGQAQLSKAIIELQSTLKFQADNTGLVSDPWKKTHAELSTIFVSTNLLLNDIDQNLHQFVDQPFFMRLISKEVSDSTGYSALSAAKVLQIIAQHTAELEQIQQPRSFEHYKIILNSLITQSELPCHFSCAESIQLLSGLIPYLKSLMALFLKGQPEPQLLALSRKCLEQIKLCQLLEATLQVKVQPEITQSITSNIIHQILSIAEKTLPKVDSKIVINQLLPYQGLLKEEVFLIELIDAISPFTAAIKTKLPSGCGNVEIEFRTRKINVVHFILYRLLLPNQLCVKKQHMLINRFNTEVLNAFFDTHQFLKAKNLNQESTALLLVVFNECWTLYSGHVPYQRSLMAALLQKKLDLPPADLTKLKKECWQSHHSDVGIAMIVSENLLKGENPKDGYHVYLHAQESLRILTQHFKQIVDFACESLKDKAQILTKRREFRTELEILQEKVEKLGRRCKKYATTPAFIADAAAPPSSPEMTAPSLISTPSAAKITSITTEITSLPAQPTQDKPVVETPARPKRKLNKINKPQSVEVSVAEPVKEVTKKLSSLSLKPTHEIKQEKSIVQKPAPATQSLPKPAPPKRSAYSHIKTPKNTVKPPQLATPVPLIIPKVPELTVAPFIIQGQNATDRNIQQEQLQLLPGYDSPPSPFIQSVLKAIENMGYWAYIIGGSNRNLIMQKLKPALRYLAKSDTDIITNCPIEELKILKKMEFIQNTEMPELFKYKQEIDVVSKKLSVREVAALTDISINSILRNAKGQMFEIGETLKDFSNDYLCIKNVNDAKSLMRLLRFAQEFNKKIPDSSGKMIQLYAGQASKMPYRIYKASLQRLFLRGYAENALRQLREHNILQKILPTLTYGNSVYHLTPNYIDCFWTEKFKALDNKFWTEYEPKLSNNLSDGEALKELAIEFSFHNLLALLLFPAFILKARLQSVETSSDIVDQILDTFCDSFTELKNSEPDKKVLKCHVTHRLQALHASFLGPAPAEATKTFLPSNGGNVAMQANDNAWPLLSSQVDKTDPNWQPKPCKRAP